MADNLIEITGCEVCDSKDLLDVLDLGMHPMCDDLIAVGDNRVCKEYPIDIAYCNTCFTAHQKFQIPKTELFPTTYHYRARFTADVLKGMEGLVQEIDTFINGLSGKKVLDIGCNDGSLLNFFKAKGAATYGIEPTGAFADAKGNGHEVINEYFTEQSAEKMRQIAGPVDVITFTNVFAHIEDLKGVIRALKLLLKPSTVIVIENHYLGAVIDRFQFDTFYHEHPRTYSYKSFTYIAKSLSLDLLDVTFPSRYGGNIRVIMGNKEHYAVRNSNEETILQKEATFCQALKDMGAQIDEWKKKMSVRLKGKAAEYGPLKAKAFPGRAAILVQLLDLDTDIVSAVYEKPGSMKIGYYLPGTRIPIKSDDELFASLQEEKVLLNFAWHIKDEIETYLRAKGFSGELINIL